ncbi:hypothetical protein B9Z19DRAFT_205123 [Tuber borchii]|uniref:Uncharacterized protein n=1 Tax=Tuber borchii TaxID=42251 RepID=A0A2T6ZN93_TUBBO|nr:hypothetical protein B9Z19DRAFT_205123 [Tuber borchii]
MDSSTSFFDFIYSDNPKDSKAAYESLGSKPYQIFDLLLKEEHFRNFFSRIEVYGSNLANLLSQFPSFEQDDYSTSLLREMIRAFALSLLAERFDDMRARSAIAKIVLSVVKLSDPRRTLGHFGVRLGALPGILRILIAEGHIKKIAVTHKRCFEDLISEPQARERWVEFIMELCKECEEHGSRPSALGLAKFIRTIPCEFCNSNVPFDCGLDNDLEGEPTRVRGSSFGINTESNMFKYLLGEPLGPWKIILSQQAMEDLGTKKAQSSFENVRRKFSELASGDWAGKEILYRAKWNNSPSYRIPLFKALYKAKRFILWQIDIAFDERFGEDYQVIKVWAVGSPKNVGI